MGVRALRPQASGPRVGSPLIGVPKEELGERTGLGQRRLKGPQTEVGGWVVTSARVESKLGCHGGIKCDMWF